MHVHKSTCYFNIKGHASGWAGCHVRTVANGDCRVQTQLDLRVGVEIWPSLKGRGCTTLTIKSQLWKHRQIESSRADSGCRCSAGRRSWSCFPEPCWGATHELEASEAIISTVKTADGDGHRHVYDEQMTSSYKLIEQRAKDGRDV